MSRRHLAILTPIAVAVLLAGGACVFGVGDDDNVSDSGAELTPTTTSRPSATPTGVAQADTQANGAISVTYVLPFIWPVDGLITSAMGPEHPNGIDIAFENGGSLIVRAAAGGKVIRAAGTDDEDLGLSVVIDHGNGITTTYGHLSEMRVTEGAEVSIGETIGLGGSTGMSNGVHLHFEVRKDGQTVDPEDVLPDGVPDTAVSELNCGSESFTVPAGSRAQIDFSGLLESSAQITSARAVSLGDGQGLGPTIQTRSKLLLSTPIDFDTPNIEERYRLEVTVDKEGTDDTLTCNFAVLHRQVTTTFYARATATPAPATTTPVVEVASVTDSPEELDEGEALGEGEAPGEGETEGGDGEDEDEPAGVPADESAETVAPEATQPAPTPTVPPTPTSEAEPHCSGPSFANPVAQPPAVQGPGANSPGASTPSAQQPSYSPPESP